MRPLLDFSCDTRCLHSQIAEGGQERRQQSYREAGGECSSSSFQVRTSERPSPPLIHVIQVMCLALPPPVLLSSAASSLASAGHLSSPRTSPPSSPGTLPGVEKMVPHQSPTEKSALPAATVGAPFAPTAVSCSDATVEHTWAVAGSQGMVVRVWSLAKGAVVQTLQVGALTRGPRAALSHPCCARGGGPFATLFSPASPLSILARSTHIGSWQCRSNAPRRSSAYLVLRAARAPTCCQVPLTAALPYSAPSLDERVMRQMVSLRCIPFFRDLRRRSPPAAQGLTAVGVTTRRSLPTAFCRCSFRRSVIWWWLASTRGFSVCGALVGCRVHQLRWAGKQTEQAPALWHLSLIHI